MQQAVSTARINEGRVSVTDHSRRQGNRLITGPRSKETICACRVRWVTSYPPLTPNTQFLLDMDELIGGIIRRPGYYACSKSQVIRKVQDNVSL
jgi:hypothetical protein